VPDGRKTQAEIRRGFAIRSFRVERARGFIDQLRKEGHAVAQDWLARWPDVGCYPDDAAYW
jgi:hypothetical protein